jgi:hypothetical protein
MGVFGFAYGTSITGSIVGKEGRSELRPGGFVTPGRHRRFPSACLSAMRGGAPGGRRPTIATSPHHWWISSPWTKNFVGGLDDRLTAAGPHRPAVFPSAVFRSRAFRSCGPSNRRGSGPPWPHPASPSVSLARPARMVGAPGSLTPPADTLLRAPGHGSGLPHTCRMTRGLMNNTRGRRQSSLRLSRPDRRPLPLDSELITENTAGGRVRPSFPTGYPRPGTGPLDDRARIRESTSRT